MTQPRRPPTKSDGEFQIFAEQYGVGATLEERIKSLEQPRGPWKRAPDAWGGEWWYNAGASALMHGPEPWKRFVKESVQGDPEAASPKPGFLDVHEPYPTRAQFPQILESHLDALQVQWKTDHAAFKRLGDPPWLETFRKSYPGRQELAEAEFERYGMGRPVLGEIVYGWRIWFPNSQWKGWDYDAYSGLLSPANCIAQYQEQLITVRGEKPFKPHPLLPPFLLDQT